MMTSSKNRNNGKLSKKSSEFLTDHPSDGFVSEADWKALWSHLKLSKREATVAKLMFEGKTRSQIADEIGCALGTVRVYIERLYRKLKVEDNLAMVLRIVRVHLSIKQDGESPPMSHN